MDCEYDYADELRGDVMSGHGQDHRHGHLSMSIERAADTAVGVL